MKKQYRLLIVTSLAIASFWVPLQAQTLNYVPKWTPNTSTFGNSLIFDDGTNVGIGTTTPAYRLDVFSGDIRTKNNLYIRAVGTGNGISADDGTGTTIFSLKRQASNEIRLQGYGFLTFYTNGSTGTEKMRIDGNGNVGIGITSPLAKLHMNNGSLLISGTTGATPTSGNGTRMMWIPGQGAFRAGIALFSEWDNANIGYNSVAFGTATTASGSHSSAFGHGTVASGVYSCAFGLSTVASNSYSSALGYGTSASGSASTSLGNATTASGTNSTALGYNTTAQAYTSVVLGQYNIISGTQNSWVTTEPLFVIGNGTGTSARSNAVTVLKNGKMLIGNPSLSGFMGTPDGYLLFVQQGILAEKVKVAVCTTANWADYVFEKNYKLRDLKELEAYIEKNKHLPNIPSAEEVVKNGIDLAEINAKLLEKIEELSLYIINQNKEIEKINTRLQSLEK